LTNPKKYDIIIKMRKLSLGVVCYATMSVVLILGACMKPVGISDLLEDERSQSIIDKGKTGGKIQIEIDNPDDLKPVLSRDGQPAPLGENATVTLGIGASDTAYIVVTNAIAFDNGSIKWYGDDDEITAGISQGGARLDISAGSAPFDVKGMYSLTVIGTVSGTPYSANVLIKIED
jgi:hypothetical protein